MFIMRRGLVVVLLGLFFLTVGCGVPFKKSSEIMPGEEKAPPEAPPVKPENPETLSSYLPPMEGWKVNEEKDSLQLRDGSWYWAAGNYRRGEETVQVELMALDWDHSLMDFIRRGWPEKEYAAPDGSFARMDRVDGQQVFMEHVASRREHFAGAIAGRFIVMVTASNEEALRAALDNIDLRRLAGFR